MSDQLNRDEEDLLQSALETAFQPARLRREALDPPADVTLAPEPQPGELSASAEDNTWKREYEAQLTEWRTRSAEQREKAEAERKKWEEIRAKERESGVESRGRFGEGEAREWESVSASLGPGSTRVGSGSPSVVDARDLVSGEESRGERVLNVVSIPQSANPSPPETSAAGHDRHLSGSGEKWEDVPVPSSMTSSYPSLSYPSDPHSPVSSQQHRALPHHGHDHAGGHEHKHTQDRAAPAPTTTATSAIFDSNLSTKTRTLALVSSLAINLLLPFVNGVMLGFGEIFARNVVVKWFSWGRLGEKNARPAPGRVATNVGVNASGASSSGKVPWRT
ncbi:hypothetical protein EIP91_004388 [Steccherinum ochraceum]|uniref:Uncharacterized protein n=1 Tax=Steccherinum ochraceum TaxID=92696 RepID=A0A4R0RZX9_9APHY|nr:hypothetical protein EIP91_004388 [Steccherinum ochraceum]